MTLSYQKGRVNIHYSTAFCRIGAVVVFFLEITWAVTLFLQVCLRYVSFFSSSSLLRTSGNLFLFIPSRKSSFLSRVCHKLVVERNKNSMFNSANRQIRRQLTVFC